MEELNGIEPRKVSVKGTRFDEISDLHPLSDLFARTLHVYHW
jgi:hypothetical protein